MSRFRWGLLILLVLVAPSVVHADTPAQSSTTPTIPLVDKSLLLSFLAGKKNFTLVDARSFDEFAAQHINGAVNVPHDQLDAHRAALPENTEATIVIYCRTGQRASLLRDTLAAQGFTDVRVLPARQIFWNDDVMVFNCGLPDETAATDNNIAAKR